MAEASYTCPRTGLNHAYWPQGNCQYCGEIAPALLAERVEIARLRNALENIADPKSLSSFGDPSILRDAARAALNGGSDVGSTPSLHEGERG